MKGLMLLPLVAAVIISAPSYAQRIYKCDDGNGGNTYQQSPCADPTNTEGVRSYTPAPDGGPRYSAPPRPAAAPVGYRPAPSARASNSRGARGAVMRLSGEQKRRCDNMLIQDKVDLWRAVCGGGLAANDAPAPAAPRHVSPSDGIGQPIRVLDERGIPIPGAIKVAPNRIWDPNTGEYRWID